MKMSEYESMEIPSENLAAIQKNFHEVIRGRADHLISGQEVTLPVLSATLFPESEKQWFPVDGMYGGFSYWFEGEGENAVLISESWCRVVGGSGQRHEITADGNKLVDEGFV